VRPLGIDWDAEPLGVESDTDIARRLGCCRSAVSAARARRGIPRATRPHDWDAEPLGVESDAEIARRTGMSEPAVARARRLRGIPARPRVARPRTQGLWSWVRWDDYPLGVLPDAEVARMAGVVPGAASRARRKRHMPCPPPAVVTCPCGETFRPATLVPTMYCSATCQQAVADHRHRQRCPETEQLAAAIARLRSAINQRR